MAEYDRNVTMTEKQKKERLPIEDDECILFARWLRTNHPEIEFTHIPNESRSSSKNAVVRAAKLKKMGVDRGVWDYELFIPVYDIDGEIADYQECRIEMKRQKGGGSTVSPEQKRWQRIYATAGIPNRVCYGASDAIVFVTEILDNVNTLDQTGQYVDLEYTE